MASFVEGTLPREELASVAAHLGECSECRMVVSETARFEREEKTEARRPRVARAWWLAAAAVLAAIVSLPLLRTRIAAQRGPIAELIEASPRQHRLVEARLSGFSWARLQPPSRGGAAAPDPADLKLNGAAGDVLEKTLRREDPESRHAAGVAYVVIGRTDEGVASLEKAAAASRDWRVWNDLAAARHALALDEQRAAQLPEALADVDRALRLAPQAPEALFNRALIVEAMGLREQARAAWRQYLAVDGVSEWSQEAREHLRRLEAKVSGFAPKLLESMPAGEVVRAFPQETRREAEGPLLATWADAVAAHDDAHAAAALARARRIADALAAFHSEHLLADAVAAIEATDGAARAALADAHRHYRDARIAYARRRVGEAEKAFRGVAPVFAARRSPMADVARYYAASAAFDQGRVDEARAELEELLAGIAPDRHRALRAQIEWQLAVCANTAGDWGSATRHADAAATAFRALGERGHAAFVDGVGAMAVELVGENDLAWQRRLRTFTELSGAGRPLATLIHNSAMTLAAVGRPAAAASMLALLDYEGAGAEAAQLAFAYANGARYASRSGDRDQAARSLANARASAARVTDAALHGTVEAQIALAAMTLGEQPPAATVFAPGQSTIDLPDAYLQRARVLRASGDEAAADAAYTSALAAVEQQRTTIADGESRLRFLDVATQIIEETTDLRLARGDVRGALAIADRARMLIDAQPVGGSVGMPPTGRGVAVIEYAVLPHSLVAFCATSDGLRAERIAVERGELEARIAAFVSRVRHREAATEEAAALYRLLIAPIRPHFGGAGELVIVPDRQLYAVPFAALVDPQTKRYLVEDYTVRFAPAGAFRRGFDDAGPIRNALVVADPPVAGWPPLQASREEAGRIASMYGATLLAGEQATRAAFAGAAATSDLIHFAGHANSDAITSHGALLLAPSGADSGLLAASEVARLRLAGHPLVVLAACGSFRGDALHVSGMSSLSRAFLLAGARAVAGTLWEIDDDVSARLFVAFHDHLREGLPPARALRAAQLDAIHSPDGHFAHPATWAPVELLGDV